MLSYSGKYNFSGIVREGNEGFYMTENDEIEIDLLKIIKTCLKKAWIIVLVAAIVGGAMFVRSNSSYVPTYSASTTMYVSYMNNRDFSFGENAGSISQNSLNEARSLVNTCAAMLKTRMTLEAVAEEAGLELSAKQLGGMVSLAAVNNTELFTVTVTGTKAEELVPLANAIGKVLPEKVAMVNGNSNVGVIDEALEATPAGSNGAVKDAAIGAVLGAFLVCIVIAVKCIVEDFKAAKKANK